ncbi:MAG: hypothetical protein EOL97_16730 [Spirochaetia bacterium]|nr:hypothetical protein [Spirochaetia bacterium]
MIISQKFKNAINKAFYDKTIKVFSITETNDNGFIQKDKLLKVKEIQGNLKFKSFGELQKEYGIELQAEGVISTHASLEVNNIIEYQNINYIIIDYLVFDSHNLFFIKKWKSK